MKFEVYIYMLLIWNVIIMLLYGIDKYKSIHKKWRIREAYLVFPAFLMGGFGAILGMVIFNHKTSKIKFRVSIPLSLLINIATTYFFINNF